MPNISKGEFLKQAFPNTDQENWLLKMFSIETDNTPAGKAVCDHYFPATQYGYLPCEFCNKPHPTASEEPSVTMEGNIITLAVSKLNEQIENHFVEALKRKGFEFKNKAELISFVEKNCRCEDSSDLKQRTYFVHNIPFFLHSYGEPGIITKVVRYGEDFKAKISFGAVAYL